MSADIESREAYRRYARTREECRRRAIAERRQAAWNVAQRAAVLLRERFDATRVVLYGSVVHGQWFTDRSDIDLAAAGIPAAAFWRAWAALDLVDPEFEISLVALEEASDTLRQMIESEGVAL